MLNFHDFPSISDAIAYKEQFRAKLNRAGDIVNYPGHIVDEALRAFQLNIDLSVAIQKHIMPDREQA